MMVVGCAKLAWHDQALLNAVATAAIESQNALNPQTLVRTSNSHLPHPSTSQHRDA